MAKRRKKRETTPVTPDARALPWPAMVVVAILAVAGYELFVVTPRFEAFESRLEDLGSESRQLRVELSKEEPLEIEAPATLPVAEADALPVARPLHAYPVPETASFCGETIPLHDPDVHLRFEAEWNRFLVNRHWLVSWMRRSRDAYPPVEAMLARAGLPDDLKYVMTIESAIDPRATSSAGAAGYWQFIRGTGRRYGLRRTTTLDERRDLTRATEAAIAYLSDLYEEFESWPLALSSYNAGEGRVRGCVNEQGTDDYYALNLPQETEAYWFKAAALKILFENAEAYGFELPDDGWEPVACDTLRIRNHAPRLDLRDVAAAAQMSYRELKHFNPWYRRSYMGSGDNKLVIPSESVNSLVAAYPQAEIVGQDLKFARTSDASEADPAGGVLDSPAAVSLSSPAATGAPWH